VWHRNSVYDLIQRFFFSLIIMSSILVFTRCIEDEGELTHCITRTSVPLILVLVIVTLKVSITSINRLAELGC
jgi:hypothetical protein